MASKWINPNPPAAAKTWDNARVLLVLVGAIALKLVLLWTSQSAVDGDEAVVGIMAKHILELKEFPLVFYGQNFGGGALIEALVALPFFASFEISSTALKAAGLIVFLAVLVMLYVFAQKFFGVKPALISTLLLATSPTFVEWGLKTRGGHILSLFWGLVICYVLFERVLPLTSHKESILQPPAERSYRNSVFGLGLLCGLSIWILHTNAVLVFLVVLFWFGAMWYYRTFKGVLAMVLGVTVGLSPLVLHAIVTGQGLVNVLFRPRDGMLSPSVTNAWRNLTALVEWLGPAFFSPRLDSSIALYEAGHIHFYSKVLFMTGIIAITWLIISVSKAISAYPARSFTLAEQVRAFVAIFIVIYLAAFTLIEPDSNQPRYLLPLAPFWTIAIALAVDQLLLHRRAAMNGTGYLLLGLFLGVGGYVHVQWILQPPSFYFAGSVYEYLPQAEVKELIGFLRAQEIRYAYIPDHLMEWKTIFESREEIIAARLDRSHRYKPYVDAIDRAVVKERQAYAVVLMRTEEAYSRWVMENIGQLIERVSLGTRIRKQSFGKYILVYYDFPGPFFPPLAASKPGASDGY